MTDHATGHVLAGAEPDRSEFIGRLASDCITALLQVSVCLLIIALPILGHAVHPALGLLTVVLVMTACAFNSPQLAVSAVLAGFMFQNLVVSLLAGGIESKSAFDMMRAYNFFALCISWVVLLGQAILRWQTLPPGLRSILRQGAIVLAFIGAYFLMGFALFGTLAIVNLRNIVIPTLFFQICVVSFALSPIRMTPVLTGLAVLYACCGLVEAFSRDTWLAWSDSKAYWDLAKGQNWATLDYDKLVKTTGVVITGLTDSFKIDFFNSPLLSDMGLVVLRMFGPNMHAISFAYCLSFFAVFTLYRGRLVQTLVLVVLMILASAKGPVIVFLGAGAGWVLWQLVGKRGALLVYIPLLMAYAAAVFITGLHSGDFHVLGLIAGVEEFVANPIGHGIGAGGNLSPLFDTIDWYHAQAAGRTPFPVESSIGVLLYQMGVFAIVVLAFYVSVAMRLLTLAEVTRNSLHIALAFALLTIFANGLFQEEALFAPLALSIFLALAGMILGAGVRTGIIKA